MSLPFPLELLAPAADRSVAKAAIDSGADAVYIGAPRFGARVKAGNSVSDIAETVRYAHFYGAKVYVTLNTILSDAEWEEARLLAWQCYEAGVDAFIIQDMAWLMAEGRPPAVWHASTQCDIRTPAKARLLAEVGVSRLILARELSLPEIADLHAAVPNVELEAFVHGALCVSYSGQCYMSEYMFGRSGNRGECAQACRLAYDLVNASGKCLAKDLHLLSLKDLSLAAYVADMAAGGVRSFKIEGRLKDICYVKNVTAYYRRALDKVIGGVSACGVSTCGDTASAPYRRASFGHTTLGFEPDLEKGFHRPYSTYFLDPTKRGEKASIHTPKAMGEYIGRVARGAGRSWQIETDKTLCNGDGLCFFDEQNRLVGFGVNEVAVGSTPRTASAFSTASAPGTVKITTAKPVPLFAGAAVYRNQDVAFEKALRLDSAAERRIAIRGGFTYQAGHAGLWAQDEEGIEERLTWVGNYAAADSEGRMRENLFKQLQKTGEVPFEWADFSVEIPQGAPVPFIPLAELNARRRELLSALYEKRLRAHTPHTAAPATNAPYAAPNTPTAPVTDENGRPVQTLDYRANVANAWAEKFYQSRGIEQITRQRQSGQWLMQCKYCIRYELRQCPRHFKQTDPDYQQDLFLIHKAHTFALKFDCAHERMEICATQNGQPA